MGNDIIKFEPSMLAKLKPVGVNIVSEYWTPEVKGEQRLMVFAGLVERNQPSYSDPNKTILLPCVQFYWPTGTGMVNVVNGTTVLYGTFQDLLAAAEHLPHDSPARCVAGDSVYLVTWVDKQQNKSNSNESHRWIVEPYGRLSQLEG